MGSEAGFSVYTGKFSIWPLVISLLSYIQGRMLSNRAIKS
jgi:hypothetical protein